MADPYFSLKKMQFREVKSPHQGPTAYEDDSAWTSPGSDLRPGNFNPSEPPFFFCKMGLLQGFSGRIRAQGLTRRPVHSRHSMTDEDHYHHYYHYCYHTPPASKPHSPCESPATHTHGSWVQCGQVVWSPLMPPIPTCMWELRNKHLSAQSPGCELHSNQYFSYHGSALSELPSPGCKPVSHIKEQAKWD